MMYEIRRRYYTEPESIKNAESAEEALKLLMLEGIFTPFFQTGLMTAGIPGNPPQDLATEEEIVKALEAKKMVVVSNKESLKDNPIFPNLIGVIATFVPDQN